MNTTPQKKQIVTANLKDGKLSYTSGAEKGSRLMFKVEGRLNVYVKGAASQNDLERLTMDLMRRCASNGVPVSELKYAGRYAK